MIFVNVSKDKEILKHLSCCISVTCICFSCIYNPRFTSRGSRHSGVSFFCSFFSFFWGFSREQPTGWGVGQGLPSTLQGKKARTAKAPPAVRVYLT